MRLLICGIPGTGKTTLAKKIASELPNCSVIHGDDFKHLPWAMQKESLRDAVKAAEGNVVVEGVNAVRILRYELGFDLVVRAVPSSGSVAPKHRGMQTMTDNKLKEWGGKYTKFRKEGIMQVIRTVRETLKGRKDEV